MISLSAPREGEDRYVLFGSFAIGPYDQYRVSEGEVIDLPSEMSSMTQAKGIWHENNVLHNKVQGDIQYHPILGDAIRLPVLSYPKYFKAASFPAYDSAGQPVTFVANCGLAIHRTVARVHPSATTWQQVAIERDVLNPSLWTVYTLAGSTAPPGRLYSASMDSIVSLESFDATYLHYTLFNEGRGYTGAPVGVNWYEELSFDFIKDTYLSLPVAYSRTYVNRTTKYWKARVPSSVLSPSEIKRHIDGIVRQMVPDEFPIPDVHYGQLAMQASEKVNANRVNMIAFLKDLRHPLQLIPKLRNLHNLKTIANNYLTVEYGILPTISDIRAIIGAVRRIAPYLDRNGFSVYVSGASSSLEIADKQFSLEQRIKLAIGDDDNELLALVKRLDSMGTLPTFENLWDLIPYSFVIDWLIDVGGLLQRVDTRLRVMRLDIRYATMSHKVKVSGNLTWDQDNPYVGSVEWEQYHRWVSDQCPVPPLSLQTTFQDFGHWLESGALLTQRIKR